MRDRIAAEVRCNGVCLFRERKPCWLGEESKMVDTALIYWHAVVDLERMNSVKMFGGEKDVREVPVTGVNKPPD
jgi:hypothetical protein